MLEFSFNLPPLSAQDYDVIKLTALYVARNGNQFQRSWLELSRAIFNMTFETSAFIISTVQQSSGAIQESHQPTANATGENKERCEEEGAYAVINRSRIRAEWDAHQAAETEKAAEASEKERLAYSSIDWHDFVVVETIRFTEADERAKLPAPMSKAQLEYASLEQRECQAYG